MKNDWRPLLDSFGLHTGQLRSVDYSNRGKRGIDEKLVHNGGWYIREGEKIGWGDLSLGDMENVQHRLEPKGAFIVLSEADSRENEGSDLSDALGKCLWLIVPGAIYEVNDYATRRVPVETGGISYATIPREDIPEIMGISQEG